MMGAIRIAFRVIGRTTARTFVSKLPTSAVLGGLVAVAALGATVIVQVLTEIGRNRDDKASCGDRRCVVTEILASEP
jgi:hypothetical protein